MSLAVCECVCVCDKDVLAHSGGRVTVFILIRCKSGYTPRDGVALRGKLRVDKPGNTTLNKYFLLVETSIICGDSTNYIK